MKIFIKPLFFQDFFYNFFCASLQLLCTSSAFFFLKTPFLVVSLLGAFGITFLTAQTLPNRGLRPPNRAQERPNGAQKSILNLTRRLLGLQNRPFGPQNRHLGLQNHYLGLRNRFFCLPRSMFNRLWSPTSILERFRVDF